MKLQPKVLLPVAIAVASAGVMLALVSTRPAAESTRPRRVVPAVQVATAAPDAVELWVTAQGTVEPRTESDLVAEVSGRVVWVSPQSASGGFFAAGDPLVRIDRRDYEVALEAAEAALARARGDRVHAEATLGRQQQMRERGAASQARLDDAVHGLATARANEREARAAVERAQLDLERTEIAAPFAGRVREKHVDVGQFVNRGGPLARVYSIDYAEIRLPLPDEDLASLDLPLQPGDPAASETFAGPEVEISARFAGARHRWRGRIVRVEGALDPKSRMLNVVARVDDPYGREASTGTTPLSIGLFVDARIRGRRAEGVFALPRAALRNRGEVLVVDDENRVHVRQVEALRTDREHCWIRGGLRPGERVVISSLDVVSEGMEVRVLGTPEAIATDRPAEPRVNGPAEASSQQEAEASEAASS